MKPQKTITAYKLFRTLKNRPGEIFPLFIDKNNSIPINKWIEAKFIPTKGYAKRPGWHVGQLPIAPHLMKKNGTLANNRVWAKVEISADVDWQSEANKSKTKDIKNKIPKNGFYKFKRPSNQGGEWLIAGLMKVLKII